MKTEKISASKARGVIALIVLLFVFQAVTFILHRVELDSEASVPVPAKASVQTAESESIVPSAPKKRSAVVKQSAPKKQKPPVELNTADSLELLSVRGIGPFYARQIIQYRERLGGFVCKEQLLELYKMDRERYEPIAEQIIVDGNLAKRIDFKELVSNENLSGEEIKKQREFLGRHPYVGYRALKGIELYMRSLSKDSLTRIGAQDLLKSFFENNLITESAFQMLKYYVK